MLPEPRLAFFSLKEPIHRDVKDWLSTIETPFFSLIRTDAIKTKLQVNIAYASAMKDAGDGSRIRKPESIFMMMMSDEDQIRTAIISCGVSAETRRICAVYDNRDHLRNFISRFGDKVTETFEEIPEDDPSRDREIFSKMTYTRMRIRA